MDVHTQLTGMLLHDGMVQPQETRGVCHSRQPQPTYCARAPLMLSPAEREAMTLRRPSPAHACMQRLLPPWSPHDSMRLGGLWCWCRWCSRCGRRRCGRLRPSSPLREERGPASLRSPSTRLPPWPSGRPDPSSASSHDGLRRRAWTTASSRAIATTAALLPDHPRGCPASEPTAEIGDVRVIELTQTQSCCGIARE